MSSVSCWPAISVQLYRCILTMNARGPQQARSRQLSGPQIGSPGSIMSHAFIYICLVLNLHLLKKTIIIAMWQKREGREKADCRIVHTFFSHSCGWTEHTAVGIYNT